VVTALALFSGSLASRVAARLVQRSPAVDSVFLLYFRSPFFEEADGLRELVRDEWPGTVFRTQSLKNDYRRLVNILPGQSFSLSRSCLSCRTLMLSRAIRFSQRLKADFIVTGEVKDNHGLSDREMERITEDLGISGFVLRPLSAKLLPETMPELKGWVDRNSLGSLRAGEADEQKGLIDWGRKLGLDAENELGFYPRCKLTLPGFGKRLENLFAEDEFTLNTLKLLEFSVYYKRFPDVKIVLATDEEEKRKLQTYFLPQDLRVYLPTHPGPMTLVRTNWSSKSEREVEEIISLAARITATHSNAAHLAGVLVSYRFENDDETQQLNVIPFDSSKEINKTCFSYQVSSEMYEPMSSVVEKPAK
jgi:tRNA-uridine 2-sulfurtransferase